MTNATKLTKTNAGYATKDGRFEVTYVAGHWLLWDHQNCEQGGTFFDTLWDIEDHIDQVTA